MPTDARSAVGYTVVGITAPACTLELIATVYRVVGIPPTP